MKKTVQWLRDLFFQKKKNNRSAKKKQWLHIFSSGMTLAGSWSVVSNAHIQAFTFLPRWNSQDHGRLSVMHISKHSHKNFAHVLDSLVRTAKEKGAVGTSTRADACAFTGDPQPRLFEFTSLWHSGHCAEITLCLHFWSHCKKKKICHCLHAWERWSGNGNTGTHPTLRIYWSPWRYLYFLNQSSCRSECFYSSHWSDRDMTVKNCL